MPDLITRHRVPILEVGTFPLSTGETTFTLDDLQGVVASQSDPHVPSARLKIGHWGGDEPENMVTFCEEPVFGTLANYELDGLTLYADITGVPSWFDGIWETAFPNRSIEGLFNFTANSGKKYPLVLSALSLLGVSMPGVSTLPDLAALYTTEEVPDGVVLASYKGGKPVPRTDAAVSVEQLRRDFYDNVAAGDQLWWWVREVQLDPQQVICDSDDGDLYRVPYTISGESIEWGEPTEVKIVYEDVAADAADTNGKVVIFATAAESRPNDRQRENNMPETKARRPSKKAAAAGTVAEPKPGTTDTDPEDEVDDDTLDDGDDDTGAEKPGDGKGPDDPSQPKETTASSKIEVPEGFALVPKAVLDDLKVGAKAGVEARAVQLTKHRDSVIAAAIDKGKFAPAQREQFEKLWAADPAGTEDIINVLAEDTIPVAQRAVGGGGEEQATSASVSYPSAWLTESEQAVVASRNGKGA
jgi:hypothetical protein